jgi:hypothetical protein
VLYAAQPAGFGASSESRGVEERGQLPVYSVGAWRGGSRRLVVLPVPRVTLRSCLSTASSARLCRQREHDRAVASATLRCMSSRTLCRCRRSVRCWCARAAPAPSSDSRRTARRGPNPGRLPVGCREIPGSTARGYRGPRNVWSVHRMGYGTLVMTGQSAGVSTLSSSGRLPGIPVPPSATSPGSPVVAKLPHISASSPLSPPT